MSEYEIISPAPDEYRKLVTPNLLDFPGSVFYEPEFLLAMADILNLKFKPVVVLSNECIVGLANFLERVRAGVKLLAIPALTQYYGPINLQQGTDIRGVIFDKLIKNNIDMCIFSLPPESGIDFEFCGWRVSERLTYYLELNNFKNMLTSCSQNCRNKINKALRSDIEIVESNGIPVNIYAETFARRGLKSSIQPDILAKWSNILHEKGLLKTFIARHNSISVAFRSVLYYGRYAYNWVSGVLPEAFRYGASNLLMLKVGEYLYSQGFYHYDLVGGDIKSIADFKKSFGGIPKKHIQVERSFSLKGKIYRGLMKMKARLNE